MTTTGDLAQTIQISVGLLIVVLAVMFIAWIWGR